MDTGSGLMEIGNEPADGGHVFVGVYAPNKIEVVICLVISVDMLLCTHCNLTFAFSSFCYLQTGAFCMTHQSSVSSFLTDFLFPA